MEQKTLSVEKREELGKGHSRRLRASGKLPGVLYGLGKCASVTVDPGIITRLLLEEGGRNQILNLKGGGLDGKHALVKDYQVHPVSRKLVHLDLIEIDVSKKIEVTVPLNFIGKSVGVAEGGVLSIIDRNILIRCLPTNIPKHVDVDVTNLKIGDSLHLENVTLPEGIEKAMHTNPTIVTCVPPTKEEEAAPSLAPTAEPEVITAKKEEGAEEGATPGKEGGDKKEEKKDEKKK